MYRSRRRLISVCLTAALVMFGLGLPTPTRAEVIINAQVPFAMAVLIPCVPEDVVLTGELHILITQQEDSNGGLHVKTHFQPQGISGEGAVTGAKYQGTGVTQEHFNIHPGPQIEDTFVDNFRIIGQGPGNNLLVHTTIHVTVNADGVVTANVSNDSAECR